METTLVILAAGRATRFQEPGSSYRIKALAEVGPFKEKLIEYILYDWKMARGKEAVIVVAKDSREEFEALLDGKFHGLRIRYAVQRTFDGKPGGTADALLCGASAAKNDVIVCNGDDIYGSNAYTMLLDNIAGDEGILTLGYIMENSVPKKQENGVSRAVLDLDEKGCFASCKEYDSVIWKNNELFDIGSGKYIRRKDKSSMNILFFSRRAIEILEKLNKDVPYGDEGKMQRLYHKKEYLIPRMLNDIAAEAGCRVLPFEDAVPIGITRQEDIWDVREKVKKIYPSPLWGD